MHMSTNPDNLTKSQSPYVLDGDRLPRASVNGLENFTKTSACDTCEPVYLPMSVLGLTAQLLHDLVAVGHDRRRY